MNTKYYQKLAGSCSIHGANNYRFCGKFGHICEVMAEAIYTLKHNKKAFRRRLRKKEKHESRASTQEEG